MSDHKYTTIFSSEIKPLVSEDKDKYLAMASLVEVGDFIPEVDTSKNVDLLPVAFNACVINRVNKNGDVVDTDTAMAMYKDFINKPMNIEHNRDKVVGVILTAGFSEFGTDNKLTEEQAKNKKIDYCTGYCSYNSISRGMIMGVNENWFLKIIFERATKTVIGVHIIGRIATELIHYGMCLVKDRKSLDEVINTVFNYPTLHDLYKYACYDGVAHPSLSYFWAL